MNNEHMTRIEFIKEVASKAINEVKAVRSRQEYKINPPYIGWDKLSAIFGFCVHAYALMDQKKLVKPYVTEVQAGHYVLGFLWASQKAPIYSIETALLESFQNTKILDKQSILSDLEFAVPTFTLLLPKGSVRTPEGRTVDYVIVHGSDKRYPQNSSGKIMGYQITQRYQRATKNISLAFMDTDGYTWASTMDLDEEGVLHCESSLPDFKLDLPEDEAFIASIKSIVLQVLLAIQYRPDLLDPLPEDAPGTPHKKRDGKKILRPRVIGRQYRISRNLGGTHSSAQTHWRSGHWHRVCTGEGRQNREWRWFEPVLVNAHKLEDDRISA